MPLRVIHRVIAGFPLDQAGLKRATADSGAVTLIQGFGAAANLNIHLHCLVLDGVVRRTGDEGGVTYLADLDPDNPHTPLQAASCSYRIAPGPRAGQKVLSLRTVPGRDEKATAGLCADAHGFSRHAGVRCGEQQRKELERLCRTITRPAIANERRERDGAGNVVLQPKIPWRDVTTHIVI